MSYLCSFIKVYVAAVWNTYRKTRLMILDIIVQCSERLQQTETYCQERKDVQQLVDTMVSSIPYHLINDLQSAIKQAKSSPEKIVPGKTIGGLLLMHPLCVVSSLSVISPQQKNDIKDCLAWIGINMGIGQATLLSKVSTLILGSAS